MAKMTLTERLNKARQLSKGSGGTLVGPGGETAKLTKLPKTFDVKALVGALPDGDSKTYFPRVDVGEGGSAVRRPFFEFSARKAREYWEAALKAECPDDDDDKGKGGADKGGADKEGADKEGAGRLNGAAK